MVLELERRLPVVNPLLGQVDLEISYVEDHVSKV